MRATVPAAFEMSFGSPDYHYSIRFTPTDEWDGRIDICVKGRAMQWDVIDADCEKAGGLAFGGMTTGSEGVWGDQFWFELRLDDKPPVIRYRGDKVVWREGQAALI